MPDPLESIPLGQAEILREGWEVQVWALGDQVSLAMATADVLVRRGLSVGVVNGRFVKPLDQRLLDSQARLAKVFVTIENGVVSGGFGSAVAEHLGDAGFRGRVLRFGWPNEFIPQGTPAGLMEQYGLTPTAIAGQVLTALEG
jgi:1-deoxy-D-xylulose-5-phosphate synthase